LVQPSPHTHWENESFRNYADDALTDKFRDGLAKLRSLGNRSITAIMCAETVWWRCPRRIIADDLLASGWPVFHILGPGKIEPASLTSGAHPSDNVITYPAPHQASRLAPIEPARAIIRAGTYGRAIDSNGLKVRTGSWLCQNALAGDGLRLSTLQSPSISSAGANWLIVDGTRLPSPVGGVFDAYRLENAGKAPLLRPEGGHERLDAQDVQHPGEIVGEHMQGHLAGHLR
jgi:hypothetical protein